MKNKKFVIMLLACLFLFNNMLVFATGENWTLGQETNPSTVSEAEPVIKTIIGTMQWVGYFIAILMLVWVGIRYVTSSVGEKVKAKESLAPMLIGAILVIGATTIAYAIFNI